MARRGTYGFTPTYQGRPDMTPEELADTVYADLGIGMLLHRLEQAVHDIDAMAHEAPAGYRRAALEGALPELKLAAKALGPPAVIRLSRCG